MIKNISTLFVLILALSINGQNIKLQKNTHPKAKELRHSLNSTEDSLLLKCNTKIIKVDIFNEDYESIVTVEDFKTQISLEDIPEGKFVVEAKLVDKVIIFGLMRYGRFDETDKFTASLENKIAEGKGMMLDESLNLINRSPNKSIEFILTGVKTKRDPSKKKRFFWVVTRVNNESGSSKTMKLVNKISVDRMILRHKQELNSVSGKLNVLKVWEVYDTVKFMEQQMQNSDFLYSLTSDVFNTTPYYSTHNEVANL